MSKFTQALCLLIISFGYAYGQPERFRIENSMEEIRIWKKISVYSLDEKESDQLESQITAGQFDDQFEINSDFFPVLGFPDGQHHWLKFEISNSSEEEWYFESSEAMTPSLSKFFFVNEGKVEEIDSIRRYQNLIRTKLYFPLGNSSGKIYIKIIPDDFSLALIDGKLRSETALLHRSRDLIFLSIAYGVVLSLLLYNLVLAFNTKEKFQIYYLLYGVFVILYFEGRYQLFANHFSMAAIPKWALPSINGLSSLFFFAFMDQMLGASKSSKYWKYITRFIYFSYASVLVLSIFSRPLASGLIFGLITLFTPAAILMSIWAIKYQKVGAKHLLVSATIPVAGTWIHFLPNQFGPILGYEFCQWAQIFGIELELCLFSLTIGYKIRKTKELAIEKMNHAYNELQSVVYPHQVQQIKDGHKIRETMPVGTSKGTAITFDIVESSRHLESNSRSFFTKIFGDCYDEMMKGYDPQTMHGSAFKVKEVGDGFICCIGFPFKVPDGIRQEEKAFDLAMKFIKLFQAQRQAQNLGIHCAVGIATGSVEGIFPDQGIQSYELYGNAIVLSTRYESMRKVIFEKTKRKGDICVIQDKVYEFLPSDAQSNFQRLDLVDYGQRVRDDESASSLYYCFAEADETGSLAS